MNRNITLALVLAAAAGSSFADDITVDPTPFASSATRSQVQAELKGFMQTGVNPWSNRYDPLAQFNSQRTRAAVSSEYQLARDQVAAFTGEDSGSARLVARNGQSAIATYVAGQPRNPQ